MKVISVVGPTQSGSTMLFNLLRFIYMDTYKVDSCWVADYIKGNYSECDILIVKCHAFREILQKDSDEIFLPIRDLRDCVISTAKRKGLKGQKMPSLSIKWRIGKFIRFIHKNIDYFESWENDATYILKYEDFKADPSKGLKAIANHLSISLTDEDVREVLEKSRSQHKSKQIVKDDDKTNKQYKKTLMTQSHNSSGGKIGKYHHFFSTKQLTRLMKDSRIKSFLEKHDYPV